MEETKATLKALFQLSS